jgi:VanZ family protein
MVEPDRRATVAKARAALTDAEARLERGTPYVTTNRLVRAAACLLAAAIAALSLVPPVLRPTTAAGHGVEHLAIFLAAGLAFGLGYNFRHSYQAVGFVAFAGAVELAQFWVPGRHARMSDFIVDATSACVGIGVAWLIRSRKATRMA